MGWFMVPGWCLMLTVHVGVQHVHEHGVCGVQPLLRRGAGEHRSCRVQTCREEDRAQCHCTQL